MTRHAASWPRVPVLRRGGRAGERRRRSGTGTRKLPGVEIPGYTANMASMLEPRPRRRALLHPDRGGARGAGRGHRRRRQGRDLPGRRPDRPHDLRRRLSRARDRRSRRRARCMGQSQDNVVFVPHHVLPEGPDADRRTRDLRAPRGGMAGLDAATDEVRTILRSLRKTRFNADDPFGVVGRRRCRRSGTRSRRARSC